jgi:hypothetical protein
MVVRRARTALLTMTMNREARMKYAGWALVALLASVLPIVTAAATL